MKFLTLLNLAQLFFAQELINKVKSKCCGIKEFNAILPLKWQNTADIVAIIVGLEQETASLMLRKSSRGICGTMIA